MHRTNRVPRPVLWGVLLGMFLSTPLTAHAQPNAQLTVPIGGTQTIQMYGKDGVTKAVIKTVINEKDTVARVSAVAIDPTVIQITGLALGVTKITIIDVDGFQRIFEVTTTVDLPYLRKVIQQAVPTSSVTPVATSATSIVLTGNVAQVQDVETVLRAATSVLRNISAAPGGAGGGQGGGGGGAGAAPGSIVEVINALHVGGVQQVEIDCILALVNRTEGRTFGFGFTEDGINHAFTLSSGVGPVTSLAQGLDPRVIGINPATTGLTANSTPGNGFLGIIGTKQNFLGFLQALETDGLAKILTQPKLVTLSGRPATLISGGEQAIPVVAGLGGTAGVEFRPFGTQVDFLPVVTGSGKILLEVDVSQSQVNGPITQLPQGGSVQGRTAQRVRTVVTAEDGQSVAVGGLIEHTVTGSIARIPVLGELPFVGAAFSNKTYTDEESELVVLITPHLIDPMDCSQLPKLLPGQETRKPDDYELFLENILEAPRGPREVFPNGHYKPAWQNGPSANIYPCAGRSNPDGGCGCGASGCNGTGGNCTSCGGSCCGAAQSCSTMMTASHLVPSPTTPTGSAPAVVATAAEMPAPAPVSAAAVEVQSPAGVVPAAATVTEPEPAPVAPVSPVSPASPAAEEKPAALPPAVVTPAAEPGK